VLPLRRQAHLFLCLALVVSPLSRCDRTQTRAEEMEGLARASEVSPRLRRMGMAVGRLLSLAASPCFPGPHLRLRRARHFRGPAGASDLDWTDAEKLYWISMGTTVLSKLFSRVASLRFGVR